jgi:prepilin-type N-terminal cleavage/methylation domain-containing protein/prepilin-type processing-associated H-X9-DG protein
VGGDGFTLIELLVVISIISMLMSIMLPSLQNAREMGRGVVCLSNMRNLTFAWTLYAQANDDKLCLADTGRNDSTDNNYNWVADGPDIPGNTIGGTELAIKDGVLYKYLETVKAYKCKSDSSELVRSYSISNTMNGYNCKCGNIETPYTAMSEIPSPTEKMVFVDADSVGPYSTENKWIMGGFDPATDIEPDIAEWDMDYLVTNNVTARHRDGFNLSFADGHVGRRSIKDSVTLRIADWDFSYNELALDNVDLQYLLEVMKGK